MQYLINGFIESYKQKTYKELLTVRDELMNEIQAFENHSYDSELDFIHPSPAVVYQCNLKYLGELCKLIAEKYNQEYVWGIIDEQSVSDHVKGSPLPAYSREQEKLRQQTAFISPPTEAGVFYGNMIEAISAAGAVFANRERDLESLRLRIGRNHRLSGWICSSGGLNKNNMIDETVNNENKKCGRPYYDHESGHWKLDLPGFGTEEGDLLYICGDFAGTSLYFPFNVKQTIGSEYSDHEHTFNGVLKALLEDPEYFSIEGFEEYYSEQERQLLSKMQEKLIDIKHVRISRS